MEIKWPSGKSNEDFKAAVHRFKHHILTGTVLAIDPASRSVGWAKYDKEVLVDSGTIKTNPTSPIQGRLPQLYDALSPMAGATVIAIERIVAPTVHYYLKWSIGVSIAALQGYYLLEVPVSMWQVLRDETYKKTDENDAILIGRCVVALAREFNDETKET